MLKCEISKCVHGVMSLNVSAKIINMRCEVSNFKV